MAETRIELKSITLSKIMLSKKLGSPEGRLWAHTGDISAKPASHEFLRPFTPSLQLWAHSGVAIGKSHPPKLKKFMDKKLSLKLNGGRHVQGILRGFDPFMNLVIDECVEMATSGQQNNMGMVGIRGDCVTMLEALERA